MTWPTTLTINAWTGESASGAVLPQATNWVTNAQQPSVTESLGPPPDADPADWRDPSIGWGLVLPNRSGLSPAALASAADAPEPIRALVQARSNARVLRYLPDSPFHLTLLRDYAAGGDITIASGMPADPADPTLPQYLLIYGTPAEIPWDLQYVLNAACAVGRLDLQGDALENYVQALLNDWQDAESQIDQALVWAVDFGASDITHLMRNAIAAKVFAQWSNDSTLKGKASFFDGSHSTQQATGASLLAALSEKKPSLIVTTSHGQTSPVGDPATLKMQLGLPVDQNLQSIDPQQLLAAWQPDGAIWYAHACCSAGSSDISVYNGLVEAGSTIDQVLKGVSALGSLTAPLPQALLGAKKPLRAFIGHVEPTFDWTLMQQASGQYLTNSIVRALYNRIYSKKPIGLVFREYYAPIGALSIEHDQAAVDLKNGQDTHEILLRCQLTARDLQSMVILGDPTAMLPPLP